MASTASRRSARSSESVEREVSMSERAESASGDVGGRVVDKETIRK